MQILKVMVLTGTNCIWISVKLKMDKRETRKVTTGRGVRQGCCLLPTVFNCKVNALPRKLIKAVETSKYEDK